MLSLALSRRNNISSQIAHMNYHMIEDKNKKEKEEKAENEEKIKKFKWSILFCSAKFKSME
jgi:hypothetical protein